MKKKINFHRGKLSLLSSLLVASIAFPLASSAQENYPNKTIKIIAPLAPGGAVDILARLIADKLQQEYQQPVIVENKPGASGHLGSSLVAKSAGDGYTLLLGTIGVHAAYSSYSKLNYDPAKDLQPIMVVAEAPNIVVVPTTSPYKTLPDLLDGVRKNPSQISYASAGPGSSIHMVTALFEMLSDSKMVHVPYRGSGPALVDLIGGQVNVMFDNMSSGLPHVEAGKLRILAVTSEKRDPRLPSVPTIAESGLPNYAGTSWFSLAAPASTPAHIVEKLNKDVQKILLSDDAKSRYEKLGMRFTPNTSEQAKQFFNSETTKWEKVIKSANLKLD
ncbi:MAG: tripartite tricarboxylate transporter substrate binding protein [Comamonas sp.]|jgi:tripartite-type tricarboxylate transporter receptor subunit TctC|nr:tripartite tricarboxylate transporter substrate binding protein [Comamonas sp.]